jgi:predicted nucleic acid-binding protein
MTIPGGSLLFADSNVFIEGLFAPGCAASVVIKIVSTGAFNLATCEPCVRDVENAILSKLSARPDRLDLVLQEWHDLRKYTRLTVFPRPSVEYVKETYQQYIAVMRHKPDIEVLAAALIAKPAAILSRNRDHFSDSVAQKCGIPIYSCGEFLESVTV